LGNADDTLEFHSYYLTITKLNPQGELMWRQWMGGSDLFVSITGVDIDANDTVTFITTSEYIRVWSIDRDGILHFLSVGIDVPNQGITFNKALRTPNGDIVAVGKASQNYDVSSACFFRFSATGDTLSTVFWPVDQGSQYLEAEAYDLALMDNGNILITCMLSTGIASIIEVNTNGGIVSRINVPDYYMNFYSSIALCRSTIDGSFLVAGLFGLSNPTAKVYRLSGSELISIFDINSSIVFNVWTMIPHNNGVLICGSINGVLARFTLSGEMSWAWNVQGNNICSYIADGFGSPSTALLSIDDAGCVYWAWANSGQQVIIKLLPNGQVPVEDEVQIPLVNKIKTYPNPMTHHLNIKATNDDPSLLNARIYIFNIKGQLVRTLKLSNSEANWDGKDDAGHNCPSGIYLIRSGERKNRVYKICKIN